MPKLKSISTASKLIVGAVAGFLLSLGLCGGSVALSNGSEHNMGIYISVGLIVLALSFILLVAGIVAAAIASRQVPPSITKEQ